MTREQVINKSKKLISDISKRMECHIEKALDSGALDIDNYEDNFELPKIIVYALLKDELHEMCMTKRMKDEGENLYYCI